jgi:steroid delta-isomerase-like uncharacterized protein
MASVDKVQTVRDLFTAFFAADEDGMSALISDDFVTHAGSGTGNAEGWKAMARSIATAVPDNRTDIDDIFGDGDRVVVRYTSRGTLTGELFGVAPTGRELTTSGIEIYRFADGRIVECWGAYDMSQLFSPSA